VDVASQTTLGFVVPDDQEGGKDCHRKSAHFSLDPYLDIFFTTDHLPEAVGSSNMDPRRGLGDLLCRSND
jgi:hypothetical protein